MALNPRSSRNGSANTSSETGGIFHGKITLVYPNNTLRVFVKTLGINVGPCRVIGKEYNEQFQTNDEVLVAYLDNQKSEMIVIGRLTERLGAEAATTEPIGHEDKTESVISFNNSTRVFTIAPVGESFNVWCVGRRYTKTAAGSITLPDTTGLYYIYYSATGVLSYKTSYFTWDQDAPTAYIYYNSATAEAEFFADERHGVTLDWATHEYLHRTRGASLAEGLGASGYTLVGTGSSNADMQISIENGTFFDEDLEVNITHSATPTANTWEQRLQSPAYIPMFYRFGSSGSWRLDTATAYPVKYGSARATYNLSSGGTWSTPDMTSGKFGVTWIVATNNLNEPVIGILGQTVSDNIGQAEDVSYADLDLTGLPIVEIRPLYKLIYETNTGYTNAVKSRLASIADIRANQAINIGIGAGALSSLTDVGLTTTVANDILAYNGSNWTNTNTPTFQSATIIGGVTVDTSTFSVDAANNRVGVLTTSPNEALDVRGNIALTGSVIFEGATADGFETTLSVTDPTADRTITLPNNTGTVALLGDTTHVGTTAITLNRSSANLNLTGITSVAMPGSTSGTLTIQPTAITGTVTITFPANTGTVITTGNLSSITSTGTLTGLTLSGTVTLPNSANNQIYTSTTADSALPWANGPVLQGATGWSFYSAISASYRMGFRSTTTGATKYFWTADSALIGQSPADGEVTNTLNVMGTGRFTGAVTATSFNLSATHYLYAVSGEYGSIQVTGNKNTYAGYSINGNAVFMSNGSTFGLYDDTNNQWFMYKDFAGESRFYYAGVERMLIKADGVSIRGSSSGTGVNGTLNAYAYYGNSNVDGTGNASYHPSGIYSLGTNWIYGTSNFAGNTLAGLGHGQPSANNTYYWGIGTFGVNAWSIVGAYQFYNPSDIRYKQNIAPLPLGMNFLRLLDPIKFTYLYPQFTEESGNAPVSIDAGTRYRAGLSAQNVKEALNTLGSDDYSFWALVDKEDPENGVQILDYTGLVAPIIQAIKEMDATITLLKQQIETLENK
jgi:hypothetical protein